LSRSHLCDAASVLSKVDGGKTNMTLDPTHFLLRARLQFHASPLQKFLESQKLPRNLQSFSFNDRQTGRDNKHEKQIERHMGKWRLGMRGRRKSNRHKRKPCRKKGRPRIQSALEEEEG
jgi:hypothetical protein